MLLLRTSTQEIHSTGRLVKAAEVAALADVEALLAASRAEAQAIRDAAQAEFDRQKALGFTQGLQAGKSEIAQQKLKLVASSVAYMESVEGKMVDIVMKALRKCVEEIGDEEMVVQITRKAMGAVVRNQQHITIHVAPAMVPVVKARLNEILTQFPSVNDAEVVEDNKLQNMACLLETEAGIVDATIDVQLDAIEKSMRRQFAREPEKS